MKEYLSEHYGSRIKAIFTYTNNKWYYLIGKTLCLIVGTPLYFVLIPLDFINFLVYAMFSWIPIISTVFLFLCRILSIVFGVGYYLAILPDAGLYAQKSREQYELEQERLKQDINKEEVVEPIEEDTNA